MTSVLVPVYNGAHVLDQTVPAALAMRGVDEWVWVDDGSTDGTAPTLERLLRGVARARVVGHGDNRGRGAARNTAVEASRGETLIFLDADARPQEDAALRLQAALALPGAVAATGRVAPVIDRPDDPYQRYLARYPRGAPRIRPGDPLAWRFFLTCVSALTRTSFEATGGFDSSIAYGEDFALACRLRQRDPDGLRLAETTVDLFDAATLDGALENVAAFGRALRAIEAACPGATSMVGVGERWLGPAGDVARRLAAPLVPLARRLAAIPAAVPPRAVRYVLAVAFLSAYHGARPHSS